MVGLLHVRYWKKMINNQSKRKTAYNGNTNLKRVGVPIDFTSHQIEEYVKCSKDPIYFIENYCKIVTIDKGLVLLKMWDFQKEFVKTVLNNRNVVAMLPRQTGKTTIISAAICWYMLFNGDKNIAIVANKLGAAKEVFSRLQLMYISLPIFMQQGVKEFNKTSMSLENGSTCMCAATSGTALTGKSIAFLYIDEAAVISEKVAEEFFTSVFPTLSSGETSKCVLSSTPRGKGNHFHKFWVEAKAGTNGFTQFFAPWYSVPGRDEKWLAQQFAKLGSVKATREILCQFSGSVATLIRADITDSLVSIPPINVSKEQDLKIFAQPIKDNIYVGVSDTARGVGQDYSTTVIFDVTTMPYKVVATYRNNEVTPYVYPEIINNLLRKYNDAYSVIEINDAGQQVADTLSIDLSYENMFKSNKTTLGNAFKSKYTGLRTTSKVKKLGCDTLKTLIETHNLEVFDSNIIEELGTFIAKNRTFMADEGKHDDLVMCLVLFAWLTQQKVFKEEIAGSDTRKSIHGKEIEKVLSVAEIVRALEKGEVVPQDWLAALPEDIRWIYDKRLQVRTPEEVAWDEFMNDTFTSYFGGMGDGLC